MSRRWYLAAFLVLLVGSAFAGEAEWVEVRSPHFSVVTDAGDKRGREVALRFEQMRAIFGKLIPTATVTLPAPLQIVAFRSSPEMQQFVPLWKGKPVELTGLFEGNSDRSFILLDMSVEDPWQVVFHEYAHQLLDGNTSRQVQPWFEEGFAEYFATIKVNAEQAEVGLASVNNFYTVTHSSLMPVADLFQVPRDSSIYNESGDHRSLFYAQSWLVVHYLFDAHLIKRTFDYFELVKDRGVPVEAAIQQAFGRSGAEFDGVIHRYVREGRVAYNRVPAPSGMNSTAYSAKPMTAPDVKAVLADMHLHSPDYQEKAIAEFEEVLKLQPDHPAALRGLGYAYLMKQDYHRAGEYLRKAVAGDSNDPRVLYYSALVIEKEQGPALGNDREELAVIQKQLEKSVALDPEFADAYNVLAFTYMSQGNHEQALQTMLKAVSLNPRSEAYSFNLSQMYLMNGQYDEGIKILEQLKEGSDPEIAARALKALPAAQEASFAAATGRRVVFQSGLAMQAGEAARGQTSELSPVDGGGGGASRTMPPGDPGEFLKGQLVSVDCSAPPSAVLTVVSGGKTWKLHARDNTRVIVIGADRFSCGWTNQNVAVNYRETVEGAGEVISIEVQ